MSYSIKRLSREPIIILTSETVPDEAALREHIAATANLLRPFEHTYVVIDNRKINIDFATLIHLLKVHQEGGRGTIADPNITPVFVGSESMIRLMRDALAQQNHNGRNIPLLQSMEAALEFIRKRIAIDRETRSILKSLAQNYR